MWGCLLEKVCSLIFFSTVSKVKVSPAPALSAPTLGQLFCCFPAGFVTVVSHHVCSCAWLGHRADVRSQACPGGLSGAFAPLQQGIFNKKKVQLSGQYRLCQYLTAGCMLNQVVDFFLFVFFSIIFCNFILWM